MRVLFCGYEKMKRRFKFTGNAHHFVQKSQGEIVDNSLKRNCVIVDERIISSIFLYILKDNAH